jgi:hypothetical protein
MSTQGPFNFGQQGYTVHWDEPKTNGASPNGQQKHNCTTDEARTPAGQLMATREAKMAVVPPIVGTILTGQFSTTDAAICPNSQSIPYRSPARDGSSAPHMAPVRLRRMSPSLCWELLQA